jgi:hypothetical protein
MTSRRTFALLIAGLGLGACGGSGTDIDATLRFSELSDAQIARLISAAGGSDMFGAQSQVSQFANEDDPCPAQSFADAQVTLTGGCTTLDGMQVDGVATVTNPIEFDQVAFKFGAETIYDFDQFTVTDLGYTLTYTGRVRIEDFSVWEADITSNLLGIEVRSDLYYDCDTSSCDLRGSGVELIGVGGAQVSGTVRVGRDASSDYTLRGKDTLSVVIDVGCVSWTISGSDRQQVCQ